MGGARVSRRVQAGPAVWSWRDAVAGVLGLAVAVLTLLIGAFLYRIVLYPQHETDPPVPLVLMALALPPGAVWSGVVSINLLRRRSGAHRARARRSAIATSGIWAIFWAMTWAVLIVVDLNNSDRPFDAAAVVALLLFPAPSLMVVALLSRFRT